MAPTLMKFLRHRVLPVAVIIAVAVLRPRVFACLVLVGLGAVGYVVALMYRVYRHGAVSQQKIAGEDWEKNVLGKYLPGIKGKVGWKSLGEFPTKVIEGEVLLGDGGRRRIQVKREDLNSEKYGGNKVRSLEYLVGAADTMNGDNVTVMGGTGSNQVIATAVHSGKNVNTVYLEEEDHDRDNALNIMSTLSYPTSLSVPYAGLLHRYKAFSKIAASLKKGEPVFFPGGANPIGVLGNTGAALELATQIQNNEAAPITDIFLPWGSGCTTAGICLGIAISRHLKMGVWDEEHPIVRPVFIHHKGAVGESAFGMMSFFLRQLVKDASQLLMDLDTIPGSVKEDALKIAAAMSPTMYYGKRYGYPKYGGHSDHSRAGKKVMETLTPAPCPPLWLCSTFTSKAAAVMIDFLEDNPDRSVLFWQTKSSVQPVKEDGEEWDKLEKQHASIKKYVKKNIPCKDEYEQVTSKM